MLRLGLAALASVIGGSALAADTARPYLPPAAMAARAVFDRTGFTIGAGADGFGVARSVGLNLGDSAGSAGFDNRPSGTAVSTSPIGSFVYGLETDFELAGVTGGIDAPTCPAAVCGATRDLHSDRNIFGTARGHGGYSAAGWLLYVTGGYAYARLDTNAVASAGGAGFDTADLRGRWTVGGSNIEYLDLDVGGTHTRIPFGGGLPPATDTWLTATMVQAKHRL